MEEGDYEAILQDTKMMTDRIFLLKAVRIALPVAIGHAEYNYQHGGYHDDWLAGATSIAAVGLANKVFCNDAAGVWHRRRFRIQAAQFWGNNDVKNIRKVLGLALLLAIGAALFLYSGSRMPETCGENLYDGGYHTDQGILFVPGCSFLSFYCRQQHLRCDAEGSRKIKSRCNKQLLILINIFSIIYFIFSKFGAPAIGDNRRGT